MLTKSKTITIRPAVEVTLNQIVVTTAQDMPTRKTLIVQINDKHQFKIDGAEYEQLGQWTDESLLAFMVAKLGLEAA